MSVRLLFKEEPSLAEWFAIYKAGSPTDAPLMRRSNMTLVGIVLSDLAEVGHGEGGTGGLQRQILHPSYDSWLNLRQPAFAVK
jgi:hypothetical protein